MYFDKFQILIRDSLKQTVLVSKSVMNINQFMYDLNKSEL